MPSLLLQAFGWGLLLSFIASIPPGMLSLRVRHMSLVHSQQGALCMAFGAAAVEVIYTSLALQLNILAYHVSILYPYVYLWVAICMLFFAYKAYAALDVSWVDEKETKRLRPFVQGLLLGIANLLPIPFWVALSLYIQEQGFVSLLEPEFLYSYLIGIGLGTWLFLCCVVVLSKRLSWNLKPGKQIKISAAIYVVVAVYLLYKGIRLL